MYGRQKNLHEVKELFTIKTDPNNTTVGEAVHTILEYVELVKIRNLRRTVLLLAIYLTIMIL